MRISLAALIVAAAAALSASTAFGHRDATSCKGDQLQGRFAAVPGSAGAGNIVYKLSLLNTSPTTCTVQGLPAGQLLSATKAKLPTHVRAARANQPAGPVVTLAHGASAFATARFSPDVPGPGEQATGPCEPKAYWFNVRAPGGGTTPATILQATSVCEHGTLSFSNYAK